MHRRDPSLGSPSEARWFGVDTDSEAYLLCQQCSEKDAQEPLCVELLSSRSPLGRRSSSLSCRGARVGGGREPCVEEGVSLPEI